MSEVVENVGEQNSAPSNEEAAQATMVENIINCVIETVVAKMGTDSAIDTTKEADKSSPKPAAEVSISPKVDDKPAAKEETPSKLTAEETSKPAVEEETTTSPKVDNKKTPVKRTPSKRMTFIERAQKESEELVKNMGGNLEIDGGRRTRSSTRGTPTRSAAAATPPPAKKARTSPASGASTPTRARGRGRKIDTAVDGAAEDETTPTPSKKKTPAKGKKAAAKDEHPDEEMEDKPEEEDVKDVEKTTNADKSEVDAAKEDKDDLEKSAVNVKEPMDIPETSVESKKTTEEKEITSKEEKVENVEETKAEDKTDTVLESVVEETQSQVTAESPEEKITNAPENAPPTEKIADKCEPATKKDSSLATKPVESVNATKSSAPVKEEKKDESKKNVEKPLVLEDAKEPTPEPMDVDSSSKSSDAVEKMDEDVIEIKEKTPQIDEEKNSQQSTVAELNNTEKVEKNAVKQNSVETVAATDVVITNSIDVKSAAGEPEATDVATAKNEKNTGETTPAAKNANDLCEPKIATSPPISATNDNSTVTTPQTCN